MSTTHVCISCYEHYRVVQKTDPLVNFDDNFGKHGPILTTFSLLQQEIYGAQNLSYFSHLTFIMLLHYLAKQTRYSDATLRSSVGSVR